MTWRRLRALVAVCYHVGVLVCAPPTRVQIEKEMVTDMSRAERRAAERRAKTQGQRSLSGWRYVVMAVVTFAMVFSSLGYIVSYGGAWAAAACVAACVACASLFWLYLRSRERSA